MEVALADGKDVGLCVCLLTLGTVMKGLKEYAGRILITKCLEIRQSHCVVIAIHLLFVWPVLLLFQNAYRYGSYTPLSSLIRTACTGVTHCIHIKFDIFIVRRVSKTLKVINKIICYSYGLCLIIYLVKHLSSYVRLIMLC